MTQILDTNIVVDIRRVAEQLGRDRLSRSEYIQHGRFSVYQIYDGGRTWEDLCAAAGVATKKKEPVPDEVYFQRLQNAVRILGRLPKVSERKKFGLNFSKRRYSTLNAFIERAAKLDLIQRPDEGAAQVASSEQAVTHSVPGDSATARFESSAEMQPARPVPPIPIQTKRTRWERTGIDGFPYAPQDELGVVAIFAILCSRGTIGWQILELRSGKGIDATCFDHVMQKEIHVELKYTLSRTTWNHRIEDVDYVVCWENRWLDFPKPVIVLRELVKVAE